MEEETTTDLKRPSVPANYVSILQLRERWIKEKEQKRKEQEEKDDEERRRKHHAEEQDPKKPQEVLDQMRLNQSDQKNRGWNSKKDEPTDGGEARRSEKEETAAIGSERGEDEGLPEKKRGRRKRYDKKKKKKRTTQEAGVVEECGLIKPPEYTVKDEIRVYRKKEEKAMGNKCVEKAVRAIETQFKDLSILRGQETKKLKAQTGRDLPLLGRVRRMPIETATMVWVKKGINESAGDGNASGCVKPAHA